MTADTSSLMGLRDPRSLWRVQLALECKAFDPCSGRLVETPCDNPDGLATCYVVSYPDGGSEVAFATEAADRVVEQVRQVSVQDVMDDPRAIARRLTTDHSRATVGHFHTYCFNDLDDPGDLDAATDDGEQFSISIDGVYAAGASSSRSNGEAAELWIETEPAHRRRGYASRLTRRWAYDIQSTGRIAFYSHHWDNDASRALANRLGVRPLFELVAITLDEPDLNP